MRIAICDDDTVFNDDLKRNLYAYNKNHNIECVIDVFENGYELIASDTKYDLIILDYQMHGLDGLQTATELRKGINIFTCIIFLTSHPESAISAYGVDTYRFVLKSTLYKGLFKALDDYRKIAKVDCDVRVKTGNEFVTISTENIVHIESHNKTISIFLSDGTQIETICKLSDFLPKVPSVYFCQTHKSYAVNLRYVTKYSTNELMLSDYPIPISRKHQKTFRDKYTIFLRDNR